MGGPNHVELGHADGPILSGFLNIFDIVYADPCDYNKGVINPPTGPTVDDLVTALVGTKGDVSPPTDITIDGYRGKQLTITAPSGFVGCTLSPDGNLRVWELSVGCHI